MESAFSLLLASVALSIIAWCGWKTRSPDSCRMLRRRWGRALKPWTDEH